MFERGRPSLYLFALRRLFCAAVGFKQEECCWIGFLLQEHRMGWSCQGYQQRGPKGLRMKPKSPFCICLFIPAYLDEISAVA